MNKNENVPSCKLIIKIAGQKLRNSESFNASEEGNEEPVLITGENISFNNENHFSKWEIVRLIRKNINIAIADKNNTNDEQYKLYQIETILSNKNCHLNTIFHDINLNQLDEFLKRFYTTKESIERVPKISNYYKNYLKFFCNPIFRDFTVNKLIQIYGDNKAELYYKNNYGGSKKKLEEEVINDSKFSNNQLKNNEDNNIFSDTIKAKISQNSLTQTAIHFENNSTLYLNDELLNKQSTINQSPRFNDVSRFTCQSVARTHKDDSLLNEIVNNLDKNTIESSINERIIDKIQKNKRINNNPSTTDKTKEEKTKKSSSITKHFNNDIKNDYATIFQSFKNNNDKLKTQVNLFKLDQNKQISKEALENSKKEQVNNKHIFRNDSKKNISSNKRLISTSILNENVKSPKSFSKSNGKNLNIKYKVIDNDVKINIKSPTSLVHKYIFKQSRLSEYKNFKISKAKNLDHQSKKVVSNELKKSTNNQSGSNFVYSAKCVTPSLNLIGNVSNTTPNVNDLAIKEKVVSAKNLAEIKTRNKHELKFETYLMTDVINKNEISLKKTTIIDKLHTKSYSKDSFTAKTVSNNKKSSQKFNRNKLVKNDNIKKVTLSLYTKKVSEMNQSKSPSIYEFEKYTFSKDSKPNLNLQISNVKSPKVKAFDTKIKLSKQESSIINFKLTSNPNQISFHSRNKTENLQKTSFQTIQNLDNKKTPINLKINETKISKNTIEKIFASCANLQPNQDKSTISYSKNDTKIANLSNNNLEKTKSPKPPQNFSSRIPNNSKNKCSGAGMQMPKSFIKKLDFEYDFNLKSLSSKKNRLVKFK